MKFGTEYIQPNAHKSYLMDFSISTSFICYSQSKSAAKAPFSIEAHISRTLWPNATKFDVMLLGCVQSAGHKYGVISSLGGAIISKTLFLLKSLNVFVFEMKLWYQQVPCSAPRVADANFSCPPIAIGGNAAKQEVCSYLGNALTSEDQIWSDASRPALKCAQKN